MAVVRRHAQHTLVARAVPDGNHAGQEMADVVLPFVDFRRSRSRHGVTRVGRKSTRALLNSDGRRNARHDVCGRRDRQGIPPGREVLRMHGCELDDDDVALLAHVVRNAMTVHTVVDLGNNTITSVGILTLLRSLAFQPVAIAHMTELNLSFNRICDDAVEHLMETFAARLRHLLVLNLSNNRVGSRGVKRMCVAVERQRAFPSLVVLLLNGNAITIAGISRMARTLSNTAFQALTFISVRDNAIGEVQCIRCAR